MTNRWLAVLALVAIPSSVTGQAGDTDLSEPIIYNDDEGGQALLWLCSRGSPQPYDGRWEASAADVAFAEQQLLRHHPEVLRNAGIDKGTFREDYYRDYAGFTRNGQRYLYGSYGPSPSVGLCDGGPAFFGVEYALPSGEVTHVSYNGMT